MCLEITPHWHGKQTCTSVPKLSHPHLHLDLHLMCQFSACCQFTVREETRANLKSPQPSKFRCIYCTGLSIIPFITDAAYTVWLNLACVTIVSAGNIAFSRIYLLYCFSHVLYHIAEIMHEHFPTYIRHLLRIMQCLTYLLFGCCLSVCLSVHSLNIVCALFGGRKVYAGDSVNERTTWFGHDPIYFGYFSSYKLIKHRCNRLYLCVTPEEDVLMSNV